MFLIDWLEETGDPEERAAMLAGVMDETGLPPIEAIARLEGIIGRQADEAALECTERLTFIGTEPT